MSSELLFPPVLSRIDQMYTHKQQPNGLSIGISKKKEAMVTKEQKAFFLNAVK